MAKHRITETGTRYRRAGRIYGLRAQTLVAAISWLVAGSAGASGSPTTPRNGSHTASLARHNASHHANRHNVSNSASPPRQPKRLQATQTSQPNLLFILTDQQRWDTLGFIQDTLDGYANKLKVRTPNIDRLASRGVWFRNAYCSSPQCVPSRATLRSGNTVEHTGLQDGQLQHRSVYNKMPQFKKKIEALRTYDHVLVDKMGYVAENYGRFHLPDHLYFGHSKSTVISHNDYSLNLTSPRLRIERFQDRYKRHIHFLAKSYGFTDRSADRQQRSMHSGFPYEPLSLDPRYGESADYDVTKSHFVFEQGIGSQYGRDTLPSNFSSTTVIGEMTLQAIERLGSGTKPFAITVSFWNPHPPSIASPEYLDYYLSRRSELYTSPTVTEKMKNSAYINANHRLLLQKRHGYNQPQKIQEWTACYYAMIEEVDHWVGKLLDKLDSMGLTSNTLVIFTTDHGEMLGAHGMRNKAILLEEAVRVPLAMRFPGRIEEGSEVDQPVGHVDMFATILDYLGASEFDRSDGKSLRRFIEGSYYNKHYDEGAVVTELDLRFPLGPQKLSSRLARYPNFMIRRGRYKLMIPKKWDSPVKDMLYDLKEDPHETKNLLHNADRFHIGKAEHLKILLIEWMYRNNGVSHLYSDSKYNAREGRGDISECRRRRTWKRVAYWQSDRRLYFDDPVQNPEGNYVWKEYLYIGRTSPGLLRIKSISVRGANQKYFKLSKLKATVPENKYVRVQVTFFSTEFVPISAMKMLPLLHIENDVTGVNRVEILSSKSISPSER